MLRDEPNEKPLAKCERCGEPAEHRDNYGELVCCRTWGVALCVECGIAWDDGCPQFSNDAALTEAQQNAAFVAWTRAFATPEPTLRAVPP